MALWGSPSPRHKHTPNTHAWKTRTSKTSSSKMRQTPAVITLPCMTPRPWLAPLVQKPQCTSSPLHIQPPSCFHLPVQLLFSSSSTPPVFLWTPDWLGRFQSRVFWCRCSQVCYKGSRAGKSQPSLCVSLWLACKCGAVRRARWWTPRRRTLCTAGSPVCPC